jgi:spectinomycin phosphotransferase
VAWFRFAGVRSPPADLVPARMAAALAEGWHVHPARVDYVPEGGGSHHWKVTGGDGLARFVTVDDLDGKDWLGDTREAVFGGLGRALGTAVALRDGAGLDFVVAPVPARDGGLLHRIDDRYAVCVFPFLAGRSYRFGPYADPLLRGRALDMIAALHRATSAVRGLAPPHVLSFSGRDDLDAFLRDPGRPWSGGPFSEPARQLLATRTADLARLTAGFGQLTAATAAARADPVITHGEPHPANLMSVGDRLVLIDWDTAALAPPERDVSLIATTSGEGIDRYQQAAGRNLDPAVITLYRSRWYLDDLASAIRLFRGPHRDTPDTRQWRDSLAPALEQLPRWLQLLS